MSSDWTLSNQLCNTLTSVERILHDLVKYNEVPNAVYRTMIYLIFDVA